VGRLLVEIRVDGQSGWRRLGEQGPAGPPGSMSDNGAGRREVLLFCCQGDHSIVARSRRGLDIAQGFAREVYASDADVLARLGPGQSYERVVTPDRQVPVRVRWTHLA
jgi:hypothetical protein